MSLELVYEGSARPTELTKKVRTGLIFAFNFVKSTDFYKFFHC